MLPISDLLERFKGVTSTEKARKEIILQDINKIVPIKLPHTAITITKNSIILNCSPIIKTEILLKKKEVLEGVQKYKNLSHLLDIR